MAGLTVTRDLLDHRAAQAVIDIRNAFEKAQTVFDYLATVPSTPDGDPLTKPVSEGGFGYTADEAYLIRVVFERLSALEVEPILVDGRKLTGLD